MSPEKIAADQKTASHKVQYFTVIGSKTLIMGRMPWKGVPWRQVIKAMTPVMHAHGGLAKDIIHLDGLLPMEEPMNEENIKMLHNLEEAFAGSESHFGFFHLYDWRDGAFVLARPAVVELG